MRRLLPAALAVAALLLVGYLLGRGGAGDDMTAEQPPFGAASGSVSTGSPPPLTGTVREQADRLFERIMQARARGDTAEARFFMPMALQAYESAEPLDVDGMFHVGLLHLDAGNLDAATSMARRITERDPSHLFGLALRGEVATAAGDRAAARSAFADYLARFDAELARALPEYEMHRPALDEYRERALSVTGS